MNNYVLVAEEDNEEPIELPIEEDGTVLLTTLIAQFAGACGLKYRNPETNAWRGIRLFEGRLYAPDATWGNYTYVTVYPKEKRKGELLENPSAKTKRVEKNRCSDLIVLGLPWKSTEDDLRKHFCQFGELLMVQVKRDIKTKQSKGFGFVRFAEYESQLKALSQRHLIEGRWCDTRIPNSQDGGQMELSQKIYVGRCTENITDADLRSYFSNFGEITDVFMPRPFRAFAFVTFADPEVAHSLTGDDHIIKGTSVHVSCATPKHSERYSDYGGGGSNVRIGQWQGFGRGAHGQSGGGGGSWHNRGVMTGNSGPGQSRGMAMSGQSPVVAGTGAEFQQQPGAAAPFATASGFPPLNPAMVAAAQVALMGLMNPNSIAGIQPAPGTNPNHGHAGIPGTGPYGSPVSAGQPQGYTIGWNSAAGGQAPVSGTWQKPEMPGWSN